MRRVLALFGVLFVYLAGGLPQAVAEESFIEEAFPGCTAARCVVKDNPGGYLWNYEAAAVQILLSGIAHIVVDGECASACASVIDLLREYPVDICITPRAVFRFHKAALVREVTQAGKVVEKDVLFYADTPQTPEVQKWVAARGGMPIETSADKMLVMRAQDASEFWRRCELNVAR